MKIKELFFLIRQIFKHKYGLFAATLVFGIIANWLSIAFISLTGCLINVLRGDAGIDGEGNLNLIFILFAGCGIVKIVFMLVDGMLDHIFQNTMIKQLKSMLHDKMINMDANYYSSHESGEMLLSVNNSSQVIISLNTFITAPIAAVFSIVPGLLSFYYELTVVDVPVWIIGCIIVVVLIQPFFAYWLGNKINSAFSKLRKKHIAVNDELLNSLENPQELILMGAQKQRSDTFINKLSILNRASNKANFFNIIDRQFLETCILLLQILIVCVAILNFSSDNAPDTAGALITIFGLIPFLFSNISSLITTYTIMKEAEPELSATYDILNYKPIIAENENAVEFPDFDYIKINAVKFGYNREKNVLNNVSVQLPGNRTVAIISHSGGGKSTLLHLLCRLYDPDDGDIVLGNENLNNIQFASLRSNVVRISQFPLFIQGSLRDNFRLQKADVTDEEIEKVCRETGIIHIFEQNGGTVGDFQLTLGAENLSGGQRRLLSIARAMLKDPAVLLLDEPTTGVDAQSIQQIILPCLQKLKAHRTVLLVDHNMNFVRSLADMVLVLDKGKVTDFGATETVWSNENSLFRQLWEEYNKNQNQTVSENGGDEPPKQ